MKIWRDLSILGTRTIVATNFISAILMTVLASILAISFYFGTNTSVFETVSYGVEDTVRYLVGEIPCGKLR